MKFTNLDTPGVTIDIVWRRRSDRNARMRVRVEVMP